MFHRFVFFGFLLTLVFVQGCGANTANVKGKVYFGDKPLAMGQVTFIASDASSHRSKIAEDGTYEIAKIPAGPASILVVSPFSRKPGTGVPREGAKDSGRLDPDKIKANPNEKAIPDPRWFEIPKEYADPTKSGLAYVIVSGQNEYDIKLTPRSKDGP